MQAAKNRSDPSTEYSITLLPMLMSVARSCRQLMQLKLADIDVEVGQDHLLAVLSDEESISVSRVAEILGVRPSTTSKMTDRLVARGWMVREGDKVDARRTQLRLTSAGIEAQTRIRAIWKALEDELGSALNQEQSDTRAIDAIERMSSVLNSRLARLR